MHNLIFCVIRHNIKGVKKKTISQEKLFKYLNYVFSIIIFSVLFLASFLQAFSVYYIILIYIYILYSSLFCQCFHSQARSIFHNEDQKDSSKAFFIFAVFICCLTVGKIMNSLLAFDKKKYCSD